MNDPVAEALPFIDEYDIVIEAPASEAYGAAARCIQGSFEGRGARAFSRFLDCAHRGTDYSLPPRVGQQANGFFVARADEPRALVLEGRHRFASYRLSFLVDAIDDRRSRLRARTDARFPGFQGAVYRALVIGSGGHRVIVRRMLSQMAASAARHSRPPTNA